MGCAARCSLAVLIISLIIGYIVFNVTQPSQLPEIRLRYWGPGKEKPDNKAIKPFSINIPESELQLLKDKLDNTRRLSSPMEDVGFGYGVNTVYLNKFIHFWKTKYNWKEREAYLNQYPHFMTQIAGLNIHFIHVKPDPVKAKGKQVLPLLLVNGWLGSVTDFYKIIPLLTSPRQDADFVFQLIIPSLPGFGFSQAPSKSGLHIAHIGLIFDELMTRLGFDKYYVHGGDWGSGIGQSLAILLPNRVLGFHSTLCTATSRKALFYMLLSYLFPSLYVEESKEEFYVNHFSDLFLETGYFHIQSTKPDTIGVALTDSPAGLAAYMLEKFSTGTNPSWRSLSDGGLENLNKVELLDNIMIYWLTNSITTSMRMFKETLSPGFINLALSEHKVNIPTACAWFENEISYFPRVVLNEGYSKLLSVNLYPNGSHFAASEEPEIFSEDIWNFLKILRSKKRSKQLVGS